MLKTLNKVIVLLTFSDIFTWGILMVLTAVIGIYLEPRFKENIVQVLSLGSSVYLLTRAAFQLPIGSITDKVKRDYDEVYILAAGNILMGFTFLFYPFTKTIGFYLVLQFFYGLASAMSLVSWRKLFARNLDPGKEGKEYGGYELVMSGVSAILGLIIGYLSTADRNILDYIVIGTGLVMVSSGIFPLMILYVKNRKSRNVR